MGKVRLETEGCLIATRTLPFWCTLLMANMLVQLLASAFVIATLLRAAKYLRNDYKAFIALGPGGTPQTVYGYLKVKALSLFALRSQYLSAPVPRHFIVKQGYLKSLPRRNRRRPKTVGIAPHRQIEQKPDQETYNKVACAIEAMAPGENNDLAIGTSCFEKNGIGLFSKIPANQTCRGEVVHIHPSDGSFHMTLHPADANTILEAGWGERHPLAGVFFNRFLPVGFMMVYAPLDEGEIATILEIVNAAAWYVSAGRSASHVMEEQPVYEQLE
ncbi:hypothetical protein DOTSEDRAFT_163739 [Dothistroma septosporum NZE10]|uniref:Luciferase domain-containing protein n=1 Tax=Dothistroma septosporum (strain NZE10 / CBS 128990) TaxID=675120 RepID=N1Q3Y1_DOTSN|nr:hypothetical protein DOTSEDRAFT_163739 [Dothistroma septosporum NZE10]